MKILRLWKLWGSRESNILRFALECVVRICEYGQKFLWNARHKFLGFLSRNEGVREKCSFRTSSHESEDYYFCWFHVALFWERISCERKKSREWLFAVMPFHEHEERNIRERKCRSTLKGRPTAQNHWLPKRASSHTQTYSKNTVQNAKVICCAKAKHKEKRRFSVSYFSPSENPFSLFPWPTFHGVLVRFVQYDNQSLVEHWRMVASKFEKFSFNYRRTT